MDLRKLKTILELFESAAIHELEITEGEERLRLVKDAKASPPQVTMAVPQQVGHAASAPAPAPNTSIAAPAETDAIEDKLVRLESPMVGTFYSQQSADDEPFVKVGDHVNEGDVVCIIEAMKLFNNVSAPVTGTIVSTEIDNEQAVGFGDLLMTIDPDV